MRSFKAAPLRFLVAAFPRNIRLLRDSVVWLIASLVSQDLVCWFLQAQAQGHGDDLALRDRLIFIERWNDYECAFGIGFMHGAAAMSERILGESLRIAARLGTLRPGVPIAMEADPGHPGDAAPPTEIAGLWQRLRGAPEASHRCSAARVHYLVQASCDGKQATRSASRYSQR
jgi:hypothetical protein